MMDLATEKNKPHVIEFLDSLGVCWRCSIRFTCERTPDAYLNQNLSNHEVEGPLQKHTRISPCIVCLGILQNSSFQNEFIESLCSKVLDACYDSSTFTCMLSIPVAIMLREQAVWFLLKEKFLQSSFGNFELQNITALKDVWKFIFSGEIEKRMNKKFEYNSSPFQVAVHICYKDDESECTALLDMCPEMFKHRYQQTRVYKDGIFTRNAAQSVLSKITAQKFFEHFSLKAPSSSVYYGDIQFIHTSIHIAGRYNKFSRNLCQTPWVIDGEKHMETSIQELICNHLQAFFKAENCKFSSSGREDVDVRTLGLGRPFAIELINPRRVNVSQVEISELQQQINDCSLNLISIRDMQLVSKNQLSILKEGEEEKTKIYSALCVTLDNLPFTSKDCEKINTISQLLIQQKTPLRVLHRRPLAARPRTIYEISATCLDNNRHFVLRLKTQAGTYIKEFVHGDFNRTTPNLCTLLGRPVDIVALDVDAVEVHWPPPLDEKSIVKVLA